MLEDESSITGTRFLPNEKFHKLLSMFAGKNCIFRDEVPVNYILKCSVSAIKLEKRECTLQRTVFLTFHVNYCTEEFDVKVAGSADCYSLPRRDSASIIIITEGGGKYLASNQVSRGFQSLQCNLCSYNKFWRTKIPFKKENVI
jgi:hypothetical protein